MHGTQARELSLRVVKRTHGPKDRLDGPPAEVFINAFVTFSTAMTKQYNQGHLQKGAFDEGFTASKSESMTIMVGSMAAGGQAALALMQ